MKRPRQTGEGKLGCVLWLIVIAALALALSRVIPVKIASARLEDFMVEQAKFTERMNKSQMEKAIYDHALFLELPVDKKNVSVSMGGGRVRMNVQYTVPIDFVVYTWNWDIEHDVDRNVYYF